MNSDNNTRPNNSPREEIDTKLKQIVSDLRVLPKISAAPEFEALLNQRLSRPEEADLPWYKRFFIPRIEGGFSLPVYAYGSVATITILIVGFYVIKSTTDFEKKGDMVLTEDQISQKVELPSSTQPSVPQTELRQGSRSAESETRTETFQSKNIDGKIKMFRDENAPASQPDMIRAAPAAEGTKEAAPLPVSSEPLKKVNQSNQKSERGMIAIPQKLDADKRLEEKDFQPQSRGIVEPIDSTNDSPGSTHIIDSTRIRDSLQALRRDSLKLNSKPR